MSLPQINLVVVGHKDHGKSTLIGRLLYDSKAIMEQKIEEIKKELEISGREFEFAFLLDSLEEERKGGLTIDIMHTPFKSKNYQYTIIDCPGHKEFIEKMLTGASEADAAVLVVSTREGIQNQTKQHAFLIKTLGIKQLVVAVNKIDCIDYDEIQFTKTCKEIRMILENLGYKNVDMIPISALKGDNVFKKSKMTSWYKGSTLIEILDKKIIPRTRPLNKPLRGVVQDIYPYKENTDIVVCKIETGILYPETQIIFTPSEKKSTIKQIIVFGEEVSKAEPGDSVGLILDDSNQIERGNVLSEIKNQPLRVNNFVAEVILFSDFQIKKNDIIKIRLGTAEKKCKVKKILTEIDAVNLNIISNEPQTLESKSVGEILLEPIEPISLENYSDVPELGRFVIEGKKGTVAAGIVLRKNV